MHDQLQQDTEGSSGGSNEFRPSFEPSERLATAEELTVLEDQLAAWIDANGDSPVYPPNTLYVTAESGHLPLLSVDDSPVVAATLADEALERFKEQEPDISARLEIGDKLSLTHTVPHYIYIGDEPPASPDAVGDDFRDVSLEVTCYIAHSPSSPLESTFFAITEGGESSKDYGPKDGRSVMIGRGVGDLAQKITHSELTHLTELVAALERSYPSH